VSWIMAVPLHEAAWSQTARCSL